MYLFWQSDRDYLELQILSGRGEAQVICCADGIRRCVYRASLDQPYDYTVPHLIQVSRCFDEYTVRLDAGNTFVFNDSLSARGVGEIGVVPYFTDLVLHSLTVTETAFLCGDSLRHLGNFYTVPFGQVDEAGLFGLIGCTELRSKISAEAFTEEFQLDPFGRQNSIMFQREGLSEVAEVNQKASYAVYHIVQNGQERFVVNGIESEWRNIENQGKNWILRLENVKITAYRYTKN